VKNFKLQCRTLSGLLFATCIIFSASLKAQLVIDSLTGPVTAHEINAYKSYIAGIAPPSYGGGNIWVFGSSGKVLESCGLMYEASHDTAILDRMIYYSDAALAGRNDLASAANGGQLATWTGNIDPVWPSSAAGVTPAQAGIEQGDVLSHMVYCSLLILQNPSLWNVTVPGGDPHGYGTTYRARALTYLQQGDYVIDHWILPYFIVTSDSNHYIFPGAPNTYKAGQPAPWNQAFMLTNAFVRLTQCHILLADAPARVAKYDSIVKPNLAWFYANLTPNTSSIGSACWIWAYQLPTGIEDTNHFAYEAEGLWIAYNSGRYGLSFNDILPFANTYFDVVLAIVTNGLFAGRVDGTTGSGHSGGDDYVRDEYIYLTEFRPEQYAKVGNIEISTGHISSSTPIVARLLWEKNRRYNLANTVPSAPSGLTATAASSTQINLSWKDNSNNETSFSIQSSPDGTTWSAKATTGANTTSYAVTGLSPLTKYYYRVAAANTVGTSTWSDTASAITQTPAPGNIALNKPTVVSNVYQGETSVYGGAYAVDGSLTTRWATDNSVTSATLEVDLGGTYTFNKTVTTEYSSRVASYKIQYWNGTAWVDAYTGTTIGASGKTDSFPAVTGTKVRLNILTITGTRGPSIYEFAVYGYLAAGSSLAAPSQTESTHSPTLQEEHTSPDLSIFPNPVTGNARINYAIKQEGRGDLTVFNMMGQPVEILVSGNIPAGNYSRTWNAGKLPAGSYVVRLTTGRDVKSIVIVVTK
jgi:hypothetical protein